MTTERAESLKKVCRPAFKKEKIHGKESFFNNTSSTQKREESDTGAVGANAGREPASGV